MKKIQLILLFVCTFVIGSFAQGFVKEKQVIKSTILNKEVHYSIFLPGDYYTSERAYPVTYLLHGYGDADDGRILRVDSNNAVAFQDGLVVHS